MECGQHRTGPDRQRRGPSALDKQPASSAVPETCDGQPKKRRRLGRAQGGATGKLDSRSTQSCDDGFKKVLEKERPAPKCGSAGLPPVRLQRRLRSYPSLSRAHHPFGVGRPVGVVDHPEASPAGRGTRRIQTQSRRLRRLVRTAELLRHLAEVVMVGRNGLAAAVLHHAVAVFLG